ncbi:MAG: hypothetical protein FWD31_07000 [Planctomycetaceae bacterium]|nr:hypothetical protein [Planctomycetaceae bacterium]
MTKFTFTSFGVTLLFAMTMLAGSGCTSLTSKISLPTWGGTSSPKEIVAFWDTIIRTEDDQIYRGFAARVMFFDTGSKKALRVRGNFDVYLFDEEATGKAATTPVKIVRYQMNDLKALESDSKMFGKSYTLWVPWDEWNPDSEEKRLSLFVRFKCDDGTIIVSKQATMTLPASPEKMAEKAEAEYENPYMENRLRQVAALTASAEKHMADPNALDTEWKGTVAEHVITRGVRPEAMLTRTIQVPGFSRDATAPILKPEYHFASATDEQKHLARMMIANAQAVQNRQMHLAGNTPAAQNPNFPINQVQFQASESNGAGYQQPTFQPDAQPPYRPMPTFSQESASQGLVPMTEEAKYQEYLDWQRQQAAQQQAAQQQGAQQQPVQYASQPMPQPPMGNYAAVNTGTIWR